MDLNNNRLELTRLSFCDLICTLAGFECSSAQFTAEPHNTNIKEGGTAQFDCSSINSQSFPIWFINDITYTWRQLPDKHIYDPIASILIITNVDLSMDGNTFQCYVSNHGSSTIGVLNVIPFRLTTTLKLASAPGQLKFIVYSYNNKVVYIIMQFYINCAYSRYIIMDKIIILHKMHIYKQFHQQQTHQHWLGQNCQA